jgi:hypothetical protein
LAMTQIEKGRRIRQPFCSVVLSYITRPLHTD